MPGLHEGLVAAFGNVAVDALRGELPAEGVGAVQHHAGGVPVGGVGHPLEVAAAGEAVDVPDGVPRGFLDGGALAVHDVELVDVADHVVRRAVAVEGDALVGGEALPLEADDTADGHLLAVGEGDSVALQGDGSAVLVDFLCGEVEVAVVAGEFECGTLSHLQAGIDGGGDAGGVLLHGAFISLGHGQAAGHPLGAHLQRAARKTDGRGDVHIARIQHAAAFQHGGARGAQRVAVLQQHAALLDEEHTVVVAAAQHHIALPGLGEAVHVHIAFQSGCGACRHIHHSAAAPQLGGVHQRAPRLHVEAVESLGGAVDVDAAALLHGDAGSGRDSVRGVQAQRDVAAAEFGMAVGVVPGDHHLPGEGGLRGECQCAAGIALAVHQKAAGLAVTVRQRGLQLQRAGDAAEAVAACGGRDAAAVHHVAIGTQRHEVVVGQVHVRLRHLVQQEHAVGAARDALEQAGRADDAVGVAEADLGAAEGLLVGVVEGDASREVDGADLVPDVGEGDSARGVLVTEH